MKYIMLLIVLSLFGCADYKDTNQMIADSDKNMLIAFSSAMVQAAKTDDGADDVAISMAFMNLMNNRQFFRPETFLDYMNGTVKLAAVMSPWIDKWINGSGDTDTTYGAGRDIYINSSRNSSKGVDLFNQSGQLTYTIPTE